MFDIDFGNLTYECEKPSAKVRRKIVFPIVKLGRLIEEYGNKEKPATRMSRAEDIARVTSYYFFDHNGRYVQLDKSAKKVLSYDLDVKNIAREDKKKIKVEQHCFDALCERHISLEEVKFAISSGTQVQQYCLARNKEKLYDNITTVYKDLRVVTSHFHDHIRVKTAYRLTEIHDKNLPDKIKTIQKKFKKENNHDYAIVNISALKRHVDRVSVIDQPVYWKYLCNQILSPSNTLNSKVIVQSSLGTYQNRTMHQNLYDPKSEYGLLFIYEKESFTALAKRIYGLGHSTSIGFEYECKKLNKHFICTSLSANCGHEWIKSSNNKNLIALS